MGRMSKSSKDQELLTKIIRNSPNRRYKLNSLKKLIDENRSGLLEEIFISIMKSNDCNTIRSLCKYLELAFVKRNEINAAMKDPPRNKTSFSFQVLNRWIWCNSTHSSLFL